MMKAPNAVTVSVAVLVIWLAEWFAPGISAQVLATLLAAAAMIAKALQVLGEDTVQPATRGTIQAQDSKFKRWMVG